MQCLACGAEMRVVEVARDDTMPVPGYEHHTFRCPGCGDEERRLVFSRDGGSRPAEPEAPPTAPPAQEAPPAEPTPSVTAPPVAATPAAKPMPSLSIAPALAQRLGKLVSSLRALPASASRLTKTPAFL